MLYKIKIHCYLTLGFLIFFIHFETEASRQTLQNCIQSALENNRKLKISDRNIILSRYAAKQVRNNFEPSVDVAAAVNLRNEEVSASLGDQTFVLGEKETENMQVSVSVPVYDFGKTDELKHSYDLKSENASLQKERTKQEIVYGVTLSYFRMLEALKIEALAFDSFDLSEFYLKKMQEIAEQGLLSSFELAQYRFTMAQKNESLMQAKNNRQLALANLNRWMGQSIQKEFEIVDILENIPWNPDFDKVLKEAVQRRPDLKILNRQIEIAQSVYQSSKAERLPNVYLFGQYDYSSTDSLFSQSGLVGGVAVKHNLFDNGIRNASIQQKKENRELAKDYYEEGLDDLALEVKKVCTDLLDTLQGLKTSAEQKELYAKNLSDIQRSFDQGLSSSMELASAKNKSLYGQSVYYQSLYAYHQVLARLSLVSGVDGNELEKEFKQ